MIAGPIHRPSTQEEMHLCTPSVSSGYRTRRWSLSNLRTPHPQLLPSEQRKIGHLRYVIQYNIGRVTKMLVIYSDRYRLWLLLSPMGRETDSDSLYSASRWAYHIMTQTQKHLDPLKLYCSTARIFPMGVQNFFDHHDVPYYRSRLSVLVVKRTHMRSRRCIMMHPNQCIDKPAFVLVLSRSTEFRRIS